ncbi:MAG: TIGR04086 family membrane protein [Lachnospiraceae bacterium]|nr:TIGR04086 family membrane protein [Lachnospiraceae bacterium]
MDKKAGKNMIVVIGIVLGMMYLLSALLLAAAAGVLWNVGAGSKAVSGVVIGVYVIVNFLGGFLIGKKRGQHKMLWGVAVGVLYFLLLLLIAVFVVKTPLQGNSWIYSGFFVCGISAMFGGMLAPGGK